MTDIKIPVLRRIHVCRIRSRRRESRAIIKERIAIDILAQLDIERRTRRSAEKRTDPESIGSRVIGERKNPVADVEKLASIILHDVVLIGRMIPGTARIAIGFAVNIKAGKRKLSAVSHIQVEEISGFP